MIVFGHNSFLLKSITPVEIGIIDSSFANIRFELRQKYGHLFWIPFIPIGNTWIVRKQDGKMYQCPPELQRRLESHYPSRTSPWAFAGIMAIVAGLIIFKLVLVADSVRSESSAKEYYHRNSDSLVAKVRKAKKNDYFLVSVKSQESPTFSYQQYPLKVLNVKGDTIILGNIDGILSNSSVATTPENLDNIESIMRAERENGISDSFAFSATTLVKAVCPDREQEKTFEGVKMKYFRADANCMLRNILHAEGPAPYALRLSADKADDYYLELGNKGFDGKADSVVTATTGVEWKLSQKRDFRFGDTIAIKSSGKGNAMLFCSDKDKHIYKYTINTSSYIPEIKPVYQ